MADGLEFLAGEVRIGEDANLAITSLLHAGLELLKGFTFEESGYEGQLMAIRKGALVGIAV